MTFESFLVLQQCFIYFKYVLLLLCRAGEDAFVTSDLLHRSPLAVDIRRMWQDAISDDAGSDAGSVVVQLTVGWERK